MTEKEKELYPLSKFLKNSGKTISTLLDFYNTSKTEEERLKIKQRVSLFLDIRKEIVETYFN